MRATENGKKKQHNCRKQEWNVYAPPPLDLFDQVQICSGLELMSKPSVERCIEFGVDCIFVKQSASTSLVTTWTSLTSGRALHCCRKNASNTVCLVLRVDPLRLIIPSAAQESQHRICCVVSPRLLGIASKLSTTRSTVVARSCFHGLQRVQRPTQLRHC